MRSHRFTSAA